MKHKIFKINEAGLYAIGHYRAMCVKLYLGNPVTCLSVKLSHKKTAQLLDILHINWEDGEFVEKLLKDQYVSIGFGDNHAITIGDSFGNCEIELDY